MFVRSGTQRLQERYDAEQSSLSKNDTYTQVSFSFMDTATIIALKFNVPQSAWQLGEEVAVPRAEQLCNEGVYPVLLPASLMTCCIGSLIPRPNQSHGLGLGTRLPVRWVRPGDEANYNYRSMMIKGWQ